MKEKIVRVGSRESKLAVAQTQLVVDAMARACPEYRFVIVTMKTTGDRILDRTLDKIGGKGLFVKELDRALRQGEIDLSVHSLKDVPMQTPEDLPLGAFVARGDPRDCLVLPQGQTEKQPGAAFGCSSLRRRLQLEKLYPGQPVKPVRGNILRRLEKLDAGEYGALVLACAGLQRAGLAGRMSRVFSTEELLPAAGQGTLVVQHRKGEDYPFLAAVDDLWTRAVSLAERQYVRVLDGGCSSPVAAYGETDGQEIRLRGLYYDPADGSWSLGETTGSFQEPEGLGEQLAGELRQRHRT